MKKQTNKPIFLTNSLINFERHNKMFDNSEQFFNGVINAFISNIL